MTITARYAFDKTLDLAKYTVGLLIRPKPAGFLMNSGLGVLALVWGGPQFMVHVIHTKQAGTVEATFASPELPPSISYPLTGLAILLILSGVGLAVRSWWGEQKGLMRKRVVSVELLGMDAVSATRLIDALPAELPGQREEVYVDVRESVRGGSDRQLAEAVEKVCLTKTLLEIKLSSIAREDAAIVVGARAPVGLQFLLGVVLDDENSIKLWDFDRIKDCWRPLEVTGLPVKVTTDIPSANLGDEVVLAVSTSYAIQDSTLAKTWPGLPVVRLSIDDPLPNQLWSEQAHRDLAGAFLQVLAQLLNRQVKQIHLALAASASMTIRLGMQFDIRNHPQLTVYQFDKPSDCYTWGVRMPQGDEGKRATFVSAKEILQV